ncbi:DUF6498-containing protein [Ferruginibacter sp. SUN106]|uniref:DUF6498-containing protein n=1 Tax=Ferruginibacter sp. SUN106 TaxID=2978348 RepID=UPI003D35BAE5
MSFLIPCCGIIFFQWLPGAILLYFMLEMVNYWLCNLVLLLVFAKAPSKKERWQNAGIFSFWFWVSLIGFYLYVAFMSDPKSASMATNITYVQMIGVTLIYWIQFVIFLATAKPKNKTTQDVIIKEVYYRLIAIYLTLFCIIGYVFVFWSQTAVVNYAMAFVLVFAKSLADLVLILIRMSKEDRKIK